MIHPSMGTYDEHEKGKCYMSPREWTSRDCAAYKNLADKQMVYIWATNFRKALIGQIIVGYCFGGKKWVRK